MGILEQVTGMKEKGASEDEIVKSLKDQGVSPNEISEALSQAKIKNAVSSEQGGNTNESMEPSMMGPEETNPENHSELPTENISDEDLEPPTPSKSQQPQTRKGFQPMTKEVSENSNQEYVPRPQGSASYSNEYQGQPYPQYEESQEYENYGQDPYGYDSGSSDTMIEISEQVFTEKIKKIQEKVDEFNEFKNLAEEKINNVSERLKRIESSIDRLQADILEKVGSYGRGLEGVKKEMGMIQESFGKVVNTLADKAEKSHPSKTHSHKSKKSSKKKKTSKKK
ncbi:MAG: hypothetical protein WDZ62_01055 [Candidatus Pacearchaeota archaeon]